MEGKCLNCVFKTTQSRSNCKLHYKAISVALLASNLPILWESKTAHLHFLTGTTFACLGLCLASLTTCRMTSTAVAAHTSKWVNSYRGSSSIRQGHQEAVCTTTVSLACNCWVMCLPHHSLSQCCSWIFRGKQRPSFGLDAICFVWARALWGRASTVLLVPSLWKGNVRSSTLPPKTSDQDSSLIQTEMQTLDFKHIMSFEDFSKWLNSAQAIGWPRSSVEGSHLHVSTLKNELREQHFHLFSPPLFFEQQKNLELHTQKKESVFPKRLFD